MDNVLGKVIERAGFLDVFPVIFDIQDEQRPEHAPSAVAAVAPVFSEQYLVAPGSKIDVAAGVTGAGFDLGLFLQRNMGMPLAMNLKLVMPVFGQERGKGLHDLQFFAGFLVGTEVSQFFGEWILEPTNMADKLVLGNILVYFVSFA